MHSDQEHLTPEDAYRQYYAFLVNIAIQKFSIPACDAETLAHEVFYNFLASPTPINQPRAYLVIGVCRASKDYLVRQRRQEPLPTGAEQEPDPVSHDVSSRWIRKMTGQAVLHRLKQRCRDLLHAHYIDGYTAREIATQRSTTQRYVEKLLGKCLGRAREIYKQLSGGAAS